jgi:hypothetical protein
MRTFLDTFTWARNYLPESLEIVPLEIPQVGTAVPTTKCDCYTAAEPEGRL